jgi:hypothetical protein
MGSIYFFLIILIEGILESSFVYLTPLQEVLLFEGNSFYQVCDGFGLYIGVYETSQRHAFSPSPWADFPTSVLPRSS